MAAHHNKLSRFWQELKRRRVIHVITVYASAAFVIIELIGNLTDPLNLPANLSTIVIIVLVVGFPLAIILSWLYDLTAGTFVRTKPLEEIQEEEKAKVPNAWKIATYVSFVIIAGLIVLNIAARSDLIKPGMIQSMVVLPFDNYTGDENLEYVAAGMHASLIGDIGKVSALRVIGKTSSNIYKETDKSAPDIAKELNVDLVLEPTLTCYGDTVCILVRAIANFPEEKQIWVAEYSEDKSKILSLWNRITKQIAEQVMVELTPKEEQLLSKSLTINKEAYDSYLMGIYLLEDFNLESLNKAREYLDSAIEKNPEWATLYASMAQVWMSLQQMNYESPEIAGPKIFENLNKALELDPNNAYVHHTNGMTAFLIEWDWERAEVELLKALAADPNNANSRVIYAQLLGCLQRTDEAFTQGQMAIELDPLNPMIQVLYSSVLMNTGDFEAAMAIGEKVTGGDPGNLMGNTLIEFAAFYRREYDKGIEASRHVLSDKGVDFKEVERIYGETGYFTAYKEILRQLELLAQTEYVQPFELVFRYMIVDQPDKAMDWIEKGFEVRDPVMPYLGTQGFFCEPLFDNPRFIEFLHKMNLPLPRAN
jgi:serine/threonine-protein kinase